MLVDVLKSGAAKTGTLAVKSKKHIKVPIKIILFMFILLEIVGFPFLSPQDMLPWHPNNPCNQYRF